MVQLAADVAAQDAARKEALAAIQAAAASTEATQARLVQVDQQIAAAEEQATRYRAMATAPVTVSGDERKCYHAGCGYGPIRKISGCDNMTCGYNAYGGGAYRGGCGRAIKWYNMPKYVPPPRTAHLATAASFEEQVRQLRQQRQSLAAAASGAAASITPPEAPNFWPELRCTGCSGMLERNFHLRCIHCSDLHVLCGDCATTGGKAAAHQQEMGHAFRLVTPTV
jgi:hypothetical protein